MTIHYQEFYYFTKFYTIFYHKNRNKKWDSFPNNHTYGSESWTMIKEERGF